MKEPFFGKHIPAIFSVLTLFFWAGSAMGQANDTEYCYGSQCHSDLPAAEQAMRSAHPNYAAYFKKKGEFVGFASGKLTTLSISYNVPDQPPISFASPVYNIAGITNPAPQYCTPSGHPTYPNGCSSETEMIANMIASEMAIKGATSYSHTFSGSYVDPFSVTQPAGAPYGWLRHNWENNSSKLHTLHVTDFSLSLPKTERRSRVRVARGERGIWQRRYWEHLIKDDDDLRRHIHYIHYNPVKHGYVTKAVDWPYSSFHRYVLSGVYASDWGAVD